MIAMMEAQERRLASGFVTFNAVKQLIDVSLQVSSEETQRAIEQLSDRIASIEDKLHSSFTLIESFQKSLGHLSGIMSRDFTAKF